MRRNITVGAGVLLGLTVLVGCAGAPSATVAASPTPTCTHAVPAQPGVTPPPGCVVYDPDHAAAQNERHRERLAADERAVTSASAIIADVRTGLGELGPAPTADEVRTALTAAGLHPSGVQVDASTRPVRFGATFPGGGDETADCVFGSVGAGAVEVAVGGLVLDGGCLTMDGH